ncbi:MAG: toll/interleukin-1 receptor domain-containing protein [Hyphomonas sp.]
MASVFISHATKDAARVEFLVNHLRTLGHDVRFTSSVDATFGVGEDWFERIQREIHSFDLRIFWITPNWQSSQMCGVEYYSALISGHLPNDIAVMDPKAKFGIESRLQGFFPTGLNWKRRLKSLVDSRLKEVGGTQGTSQPFPGLQPYTEHDRSRFYGRSDLINRLSGTLAHHNRKLVERRPIKILLGQSGVGKTSLLRAGLYAESIVRAERESRRVKEAADRSLVPMPDISSSFDLALTAEEAVRQALGSLISAHDPEISLNSLADRVIEKYRDQKRPGQGARALVFFDGFERLFDHDADGARRVLLEVIRQSRINLITAVRSDLLPLIIESDEIQGEYYGILVDPVSSSELEDVIKQPIFKQGWTIDAHVVSTLISYFGRSANALPLVAFALEHLWNEAQTNSDCRQRRLVSTELLLELSDGVENPIDRILDSLVSKSEAIVSPEKQGRIFERLVFKMAQWDQASACIRPRSAVVEPGEEQELAEALCGQASRLFTMSGGEIARMRPSHDRVFVIWPRISKLLKSIQADLILHSEAETGVARVGFRWFDTCSVDQLSDYRRLVVRWGDALDAAVSRSWFEFQNHMSASARSKAEVGALLNSTERARSGLIGLMANQFLGQSDPVSSLLVSTSACEPGPHGKPYKAVTSPLIKALHQAREIDSVHFENAISDMTIKGFDGGTVEEGDGFSAFSDGYRIDWADTKSPPTVSRVLSPGHTKVCLLSDGGWGCYISTPAYTPTQSRQPSIGRNDVVPLALHLHHSAMPSEVRFNLGRVALIAQAFAVQKSHLLIALLVDTFDREGKSAREVRIARLPKSTVLQLSDLEPQERFLETSDVPVEGFGAGCLAWSKAGPRLLVQQLGDRESAPLVEFLDLHVTGNGSLRVTGLKRCQSLEQCHLPSNMSTGSWARRSRRTRPVS